MVEHNQSTYNGGQYNNVYKFNGKELDAATGMYYYGARYYDPRISIFVSLDPAVESTMEPYSYVGNNPINFIDPTGMHKVPSYYMNSRGFWIEGDSDFGSYIGNVKPSADRYMELTRINGTLYHKNTDIGLVRAFNNTFGTNYVPKKEFSLNEETLNDVSVDGAIGAGIGLAFKGIGSLAGQMLSKAGNSLWKMNALERGFVYEKMLGLKGLMKSSNFPKIDAFYNGIATSVKTLDIGAKSYLKNNAVFRTLKGYVDDLAGFDGARWGGQTVKSADITERVLEVGIPRGASKAQVQQINRAVEYASEKGIKMNVRTVK